MLRLWSRTAQAQSTCRCVSCLSTSSGGLTSRTASAASKRRLRIGNSVTALYTSIFAAAALADAQAKDQRRLEWKEKIAAVREEVDELVDEERRLLEALAARQKSGLFNGAFHARQYRPFEMNTEIFPRRPGQPSLRSYHSQAAAANPGTYPDGRSEADASRSPATASESLETSSEDSWDKVIKKSSRESIRDVLDDPSPNTDNFPETVQELGSVEYTEPTFLMKDQRGFSSERHTIPDWLAGDAVRLKTIRVVALRQLAIRFLLRPTVAHDYLGIRARYDSLPSQQQLRTQALLTELQNLRRRMRRLKTRRRIDPSDLISDNSIPLSEEHKLADVDRQIRVDIEDFLSGGLLLDELLVKIAHRLINSPDPDRVQALKYMLMAFTRTRQDDLGELVLKAILPNMFPLTNPLILAILNFNYKTKNLRGFDLFLEIIRGDNYPVNMRHLGYYKLKNVNGVDITVPPVASAHNFIYSTLIMACLRFDQPDRADAYLQYARSVGFSDDFATLDAYLKFYTIRGDWPKGLQTMKRALAFIASSTQHEDDQLERLISLMVRFCDKCEAFDLSKALIVTAVNSGFDWQAPKKHEDLDFPADVDCQRWKDARDSSSTDMLNKPTWEKSYAFVNAMSDHLNDFAGPDTEPARRWESLMGSYTQQLLSSVVSGAPTEYKESVKPLVVEQENQREISTLKNEVSQLKRMVFELTQTVSKTPTAASEATSQTDLGQLKAQLLRLKAPEAPKQTSLEYQEP